MKRDLANCWNRGLVLVMVAVLSPMVGRAQFSDPGAAPATSAFSIPRDHLMQPDELHKMQAGGARPLVLQVGSHVMFSQAHIRGAQYAGPGSQPAGLQLLESKVAGLNKNTLVLLYCGCCPWNHCPNVGPAFHRLVELGFVHVKVLYLANNFGADWVSRGYGVETGD
ncbi:MAG TPA: rhodanese-like domain-containing protein [Terracidiphilus sp.]|nr:rhodanese-like domain-containing protein [Terracidiphilus sp.]